MNVATVGHRTTLAALNAAKSLAGCAIEYINEATFEMGLHPDLSPLEITGLGVHLQGASTLLDAAYRYLDAARCAIGDTGPRKRS